MNTSPDMPASKPPSSRSPASRLRRLWSREEIDALGATTDLVTAASILGIGRTTAYALAKAGEFPVPVLRAGHRYVVGVARLRAVLGLDTDAGR